MAIYLCSQILKFTKYSIKLIENLSRRHLINSSDVFVIKGFTVSKGRSFLSSVDFRSYDKMISAVFIIFKRKICRSNFSEEKLTLIRRSFKGHRLESEMAFFKWKVN